MGGGKGRQMSGAICTTQSAVPLQFHVRMTNVIVSSHLAIVIGCMLAVTGKLLVFRWYLPGVDL